MEDLNFKCLVFRDPTFFLKASTVMDCAQLAQTQLVIENGKDKLEELFIGNILMNK